MNENQTILLKSRPEGAPTKENFEFSYDSIPELKKDEVLVRTLFISVDPYMRGRMSERKSYVPPYPLGKPMAGGSIGEVIKSRSEKFKEGDIVLGSYGWQTHPVVKSEELRKVKPELGPISTSLGVLGMPGLTAYFGLLDIGNPQKGETVVVSGAAGAVGMTVGQIAKIKGAKVIGIAGTDEKVKFLTEELGFDQAINYNTSSNLRNELKEACPNGVDIYFDNVGGKISDTVLSLLNHGARIPICGQISLYNLEKPDVGPRIQSQLLINSALMKGFIVSDYAELYSKGASDLAMWVASGQLKYKENVVHGFENTIDAFLGLFSGENLGKQIVKV